MTNIKITEWYTVEPDRWGTSLEVDGEILSKNMDDDPMLSVTKLLQAVGVSDVRVGMVSRGSSTDVNYINSDEEVRRSLVLEHWDSECGDKCCYSYGTRLKFEGETITDYFYENRYEALPRLLDRIGVEANVEFEYLD